MSTAPDILSPEFAADPNPLMAVMREDHPVFFHELMNSWVISRYDDVEHAFKDKAYTSDNYSWQLEPVHGRTILQMEGREHSVHRNLIQPAFRGSELTEKFVPVIEANARDLIDPWRDAGEVDLVRQFTIKFPINVIVDMLGLDKSDHDRFQAWYHSIMAFLSNLSGDADVAAAGLHTKDELEAYMLPIIAGRRADPGADLLSTLCTAAIDGEQMSDAEIKAFVSLLLVAGGETTDKALSNMFMNLIANPDQLEAVRAPTEPRRRVHAGAPDSGDRRGLGLEHLDGDRVGGDGRHVVLVAPLHCRLAQAGAEEVFGALGGTPRRIPQRQIAGAHEDHVARAQLGSVVLDAAREHRPVDGGVRGEDVDALGAGDVEEHATADEAGAMVLDAEHGGAAEGGHVAGPVAVVHRVVVHHVGEGIPLGRPLQRHLEHVVVPLEVGVDGGVRRAGDLVGIRSSGTSAAVPDACGSAGRWRRSEAPARRSCRCGSTAPRRRARRCRSDSGCRSGRPHPTAPSC
jgi:hypothetical protein